MKVYLNKVTKFVNDYHRGRYPGQRLGQAFVNEFLTDIRGEETQELFYTNDKKATSIIFENFTTLDEEN